MSSIDEFIKSLDPVNKVIGIGSFFLTLISVIALFAYSRLKLDKSAIIHVLTYLLGMSIRIVEYFIKVQNKRVFDAFRIAAGLIIFAMLYFMVFEMMYIQAIIES